MEWFWSDLSLSWRPTGFLLCFDAVGWVVRPIKTVSEMTYNVSSGTLSLYSLARTDNLYILLVVSEQSPTDVV